MSQSPGTIGATVPPPAQAPWLWQQQQVNCSVKRALQSAGQAQKAASVGGDRTGPVSQQEPSQHYRGEAQWWPQD